MFKYKCYKRILISLRFQLKKEVNGCHLIRELLSRYQYRQSLLSFLL